MKDVKVLKSIPESDLNHMIKKIDANQITEFDYIGEGEEAYVYKYKAYAIKIAKYDIFNDPIMAERLQGKNEAILDLYAYRENKFMIVEFVYGKTLLDAGIINLQDFKALPYSFKISLLTAIDMSLEEGVIPDDLNLQNIMVTQTKTPKIIDYGNFYMCNKKILPYIKEEFIKENKLYNSLLLELTKYAI